MWTQVTSVEESYEGCYAVREKFEEKLYLTVKWDWCGEGEEVETRGGEEKSGFILLRPDAPPNAVVWNYFLRYAV
jgi:hypothetical protein